MNFFFVRKIFFGLEVASALLWARLCLRVRGASAVQQPGHLTARLSLDQTKRLARKIEGAMESLDRRRILPSSCLTRAVAGSVLLRRRGVNSRVVLGVRPSDGGQVKAHAWLESDGVSLFGEATEGAYRTLEQ